METLKFEWDPNKNETNKKKHGLSFETAKEVFYDEFAILFDDPDHSDDEERFLIIGETKAEQICIVSHCYRDHENVIRIISARRATRTDRQKRNLEEFDRSIVFPMADHLDFAVRRIPER